MTSKQKEEARVKALGQIRSDLEYSMRILAKGNELPERLMIIGLQGMLDNHTQIARHAAADGDEELFQQAAEHAGVYFSKIRHILRTTEDEEVRLRAAIAVITAAPELKPIAEDERGIITSDEAKTPATPRTAPKLVLA